jgi:hypothetical protein
MKKLRPEVEECLKSHRPGMHGIGDLVDDMFLAFYNVTDDEFDYMLEQATDEELNLITDALGNDEGPATFSIRRNALELRNFYVRKFGNLE